MPNARAPRDIVFICVTGSPQVEEIVYGKDGLLEAARPGLIVVDTLHGRAGVDREASAPTSRPRARS